MSLEKKKERKRERKKERRKARRKEKQAKEKPFPADDVCSTNYGRTYEQKLSIPGQIFWKSN